jgi:hypothetical protein
MILYPPEISQPHQPIISSIPSTRINMADNCKDSIIPSQSSFTSSASSISSQSSSTSSQSAIQQKNCDQEEEEADMLFEIGHDTNLTVRGRALFVSIVVGDIGKVREYIEDDITLLELKESDLLRSPLYMACKFGRSTIVEYLISKKANVNTTNKEECTPLKMASQEGYTEIVSKLIDAGAVVDFASPFGTAMADAVNGGHLDIVTLLIKNKADVNLSSGGLGTNPLGLAILNDNTKITELLLDHGANVFAHTPKKGTIPAMPLFTFLILLHSPKHNKLAEFKLFMKHGASARDVIDGVIPKFHSMLIDSLLAGAV